MDNVHGVKVGDFFVDNGLGDTATFFKVVGVTAKTVKIQRWTGALGPGSGGAVDWKVAGDEAAPGARVLTRKTQTPEWANGTVYISVGGYGGLAKHWDGGAEYAINGAWR